MLRAWRDGCAHGKVSRLCPASLACGPLPFCPAPIPADVVLPCPLVGAPKADASALPALTCSPWTAARVHLKLWNSQSGSYSKCPGGSLVALRDAGVTAVSFFKHPAHSKLDTPPPMPSFEGYTCLLDLDLSKVVMPGDFAALWQATQLEHLQLRAPPPSFFAQSGQMSQLSRLQSLLLLPAENLGQLPSGLSLLTALTRLCIAGHNLRDSWQLLRPLQRLQVLDISRSGLQQVPETLPAALTRLLLDFSPLPQGGWQHMQPLRQLQHLSARRCGLEAVPAELAGLPLTTLDLGSNEDLQGGFGQLQQLSGTLRELVLDCAALEQLPAAVAALTAVSRLDCTSRSLGGNLAGGWQHLAPLAQQLRELGLGRGRLEELPEELSLLTALTKLCVRDNILLEGGWQRLAPLLQLQFA